MTRVRIPEIAILFIIVAIVIVLSNSVSAKEFDYSTKKITGSPATSLSYPVEKGYEIIDYDVSPLGPSALVILKSQNETRAGYQLIKVDFLNLTGQVYMQLPESDGFEGITWHPNGEDIYIHGSWNGKSTIWKGLNQDNPEWKVIYTDAGKIKNLIISPTTFVLYEKPKTGKQEQHRIYFGVEMDKDIYGIRTVSENGELPYNAIAPRKFKKVAKAKSINVPWALPFDFHPSGKKISWKDNNGCFHTASYGATSWYESKSDDINLPDVCVDSMVFTPNGSGLALWEKGKTGIRIHLGVDNTIYKIAEKHLFTTSPKWTTDGKCLIGIIFDAGEQKLVSIPVDIPLADVSNAWMFVQDTKDRELFEKYGGLFRTTEYDQLYRLYESENYYCGYSYESSLPARPYLVTTDIFWELFAASFQGLFQLFERNSAMPAFWKFVENADRQFSKEKCDDRLCKIFSTLNKIKEVSGPITPEMKRILEADGYHFSDVLGARFEYEDLKPRGHYAENTELSLYFRAFRYLSMISFNDDEVQAFRNMPTDLKRDALAFIKPYLYFIATSRQDLAIDFTNFEKPPYLKHPPQGYRLFPLSWGIDNEILNSTIYHPDWPENEQINKLLPDSLEIAVVAGSSFAKELLADQGAFDADPNLRSVLKDLEERWKSYTPPKSQLYSKWIEAIGTQWAEDVMPTDDSVDINFWKAKRLQTGLASWATLRHVTVLVNERASAECGEGGFEEIILEPPLGAVEPDPDTFKAIADLFDIEIEMVEKHLYFKGYVPSDVYGNNESLRTGVIRRLEESRNNILEYRQMALKQIAGEPLTPGEYKNIFYTGRAAEYNFLVFKSLANEDLGLSNPDPVQKIVDIAGGGILQTPYLHAAVGNPAEWDLIVPHFGKKQIVKGVVYTFNQFVEKEILNDQDWRNIVNEKAPISWTLPYYSEKRLPCPAKQPF
ncbi:MAG TPA: DUF3160 domain-containing protein [bacterium]|nr:DUF3160 domain-containing protein [bacterium]